MSIIEQLAIICGAVGTIVTAVFAWRGKKEETSQKHDDTLGHMFKAQGDLVKELSEQVGNLGAEIEKLRSENKTLTKENGDLRIEVRNLTQKIDELVKSV